MSRKFVHTCHAVVSRNVRRWQYMTCVAGSQRLRCIAALIGDAQQAGRAAGHSHAEDADAGGLQAQTGDSMTPCVLDTLVLCATVNYDTAWTAGRFVKSTTPEEGLYD